MIIIRGLYHFKLCFRIGFYLGFGVRGWIAHYVYERCVFVCLTWLSQYQKSERMAARHQLPIDNMVDDLGDAHSKVNYHVVYRKLMTLVTHTWMRMSQC